MHSAEISANDHLQKDNSLLKKMLQHGCLLCSFRKLWQRAGLLKMNNIPTKPLKSVI